MNSWFFSPPNYSSHNPPHFSKWQLHSTRCLVKNLAIIINFVLPYSISNLLANPDSSTFKIYPENCYPPVPGYHHPSTGLLRWPTHRSLFPPLSVALLHSLYYTQQHTTPHISPATSLFVQNSE